MRTFQLPTATEVFQLRAVCQQLGEKLGKSLSYGANWSREVMTNYNPGANRCYVTLDDSDATDKRYLKSLCDGQTGDILATASTEGNPCCRKNSVGQIFMVNNIDTVGDCSGGGDCGYRKVLAFIDEKMKRDDAVTR